MRQADYCAHFEGRLSRILAPSLASDLVPHASLSSLPFTSTPRTARACAEPSISRLGEVSRTILHGICARAPPAADFGTPPTRLTRRPARCSRPAFGHAGAGRGGCRSLRSILTGGWSAAAAMVGAEPSTSAAAVAAAAAAAAVGPLSRRRVWRGGDGAASGRCESRREAAVERAMAGREAAGAAATRAGACTTAVKVQRARARAFLLM